MTVPSVLIALASGLTVGGVVAETVDLGFPLDKLIGAGAAGLVIFVVLVFLKRDERVQTLHSDTVKDIATNFSETAVAITKNFAETTKAADERAERREEKLRELFHGMTRDRA